MVLGLPLRTLVFHALWLLLVAYGAWLLLRPLPPPLPSLPPLPSRPGRPPWGGRLPWRPSPAWWAALTGILALALALRLHELGQRSLWLDEAISLWLARLPWGHLLPTLATHDESPPLYFALLHLWRAGGENEAPLRLLSVLASVVAVALGAALGTALGGRGAGLLGALFLALSPVQVHHGQEARMYALVSALTLAATWGALRLLLPRARPGPAYAPAAMGYARGAKGGRSGTPGPVASPPAPVAGPPRAVAVAWGAVLGALAATHHTAALAGAAAALGALLALPARRGPGGPGGPGRSGGGRGERLRPLLPFALAGLTAALLWAPVAPVLLAQSRLVAGSYWIPRPTREGALGVLLDAGLGSLPLARHVQISDPLPLRRPADVIPAVLALPRLEPWRQGSLLMADAGAQVLLYLGALLFVGLVAAGRRRGRPGVLVPLAVVLLPALVLLLVSQVRPLLLARTLVGSGAVALVLLAVAVAALPTAVRFPAAGAILTALLLGLGQYWWYPGLEDWRTVAGRLAGQARPGDLVLINGRWTQLPLDYYLAGWPPAATLEERGVPLDFGARGKPEPVTTEDDLPRLQRLTAGRDRVWLVLSHSFDTDPRNLTRQALEREFPCFEVWPYQGVTLHLFTRC